MPLRPPPTPQDFQSNLHPENLLRAIGRVKPKPHVWLREDHDYPKVVTHNGVSVTVHSPDEETAVLAAPEPPYNPSPYPQWLPCQNGTLLRVNTAAEEAAFWDGPICKRN